MRYYIQVIASNYLKNLTDEPKAVKAHPGFLYGADTEQFREGFLALRRLFRSLYADIAENPAAFGMLLKENAEPNAKNADYTNSGASFLRVPNLLLALGAAGTLRPDLSLEADGGKLLETAKTLKITGMPLLLKKLGEYGLISEGAAKAGGSLRVSCPDSRHLTAALKAMSEAVLLLNKGNIKGPKNYFYMLHAGLLEKEKVAAPKLDAGAVFRTLDGEMRGNAEKLHAAVAGDCRIAVRMGGFMRNDWSCVYTGTKSKKVLLSLKTEQDRLDAKLNLQHIGTYINVLGEYPEGVRETIRTGGWECGHCHGTCAGPFSFELDGKAYNKCRCGAFYFQNVAAADVPYCIDLLKKETASQ